MLYQYALFTGNAIQQLNADRIVSGATIAEVRQDYPSHKVVPHSRLSMEQKSWFKATYGRWLALEAVKTGPSDRVLCRCQCGRVDTVLGKNLVSGASTQCLECARSNRSGRPPIGEHRQTNQERGKLDRERLKRQRAPKVSVLT